MNACLRKKVVSDLSAEARLPCEGSARTTKGKTTNTVAALRF